MDENKKYTLDKETLEVQKEKVKDLIIGDKIAIAENDAIAKEPIHILDNQGKWAEAREKDNEEALKRHEQQLSETEDRLKRLSDESQDEQ